MSPANDLAKRKRIMKRSMALGHCICDPKLPCPCPLFLEKNVCLCAGETLEAPQGPVQLTRLVENAGCASKIDKASLHRILDGLPASTDPRVLVGVPAGDDAGVYKLDGAKALVQTVDVFSPSVDDAYTFGQIAAANSVSDIYAMGGTPLTALSIVGFPIRKLPHAVMRDILRGGLDKMAEAGVAVIGGHSIKDEEIKAGFAVTGLIDTDRVITNAGARPGDALVLTKPIGAGILLFAAVIDHAPAGAVDAVAASMAALNKTACELMLELGAHACTDVTGFALAGHLAEMARSSGVDVELVWDDIPIFSGLLECIGQGIVPGAIERNREASGEAIVAGDGIEPGMIDVCLDAQTSGGLLVALPEGKAAEYVARLHAAGVKDAAIVGRVLGKGSGRIHLETRGTRPIPQIKYEKPKKTRTPVPAPAPDQGAETMECCPGGPSHLDETLGEASYDASPSGDLQQFKDFMAATNAPGALDVKTKKAIAIALSLLAKCGPCAEIHIKKAREMGFSQEMIDEAANMAISFGGCPIMMFYGEVKGSS
ncbi:MAG: selenide, water dikinase SelD [Verrucomicrobia bacterium]|nr:selenide, water dikinase SelD [Verrucomicrobiota bacterium]